jgi:transcriptional regulator with XRE-family HTH domain
MKIDEFIKEKRIEKNLSDVDFAKKVGLNISTVNDLESYDDEIDILTVPDLKRICNVLGISASEILDCVIINLKDLPLSNIIRNRRAEKGYSVQQLSERIGYETIVVETLENGGDKSQICIDSLEKLAMELDLPLSLIFEKL